MADKDKEKPVMITPSIPHVYNVDMNLCSIEKKEENGKTFLLITEISTDKKIKLVPYGDGWTRENWVNNGGE